MDVPGHMMSDDNVSSHCLFTASLSEPPQLGGVVMPNK